MSKTPTTHTPSSSKTTPIWSSRINKLVMPKGQKFGQIIRRISTDRLICYSIILFRSRRCCRGGSFFVNDQRYFTFLYSSPRAIQICGHHQGELRMRTGIFKDYFCHFYYVFQYSLLDRCPTASLQPTKNGWPRKLNCMLRHRTMLRGELMIAMGKISGNLWTTTLLSCNLAFDDDEFYWLFFLDVLLRNRKTILFSLGFWDQIMKIIPF